MVDIRQVNSTALVAGAIILNLVKLVGVFYAGYCFFLIGINNLEKKYFYLSLVITCCCFLFLRSLMSR